MGGGGSKRKPHMLLKETLCDHSQGITCMAVSEDGSLIATGSDDKTVRMWAAGDSETECLGILKGHTQYVTCVNMYDAYVITGSADNTIRKWDATSCDCLAVYEGHEARVIRVLCNGDFIFSAANDTTAKAWVFDNPEFNDDITDTVSFYKSFDGHSLGISSLIFIPGDEDARTIEDDDVVINVDDILITGSADHTARTWSVATGKTIHIFRGHKGPVSCMSANAEGTILYTGSMDSTIRIWNIQEGHILKILKGHNGAVLTLSVVNKLLYSGSTDDTAKCWVENLDVPGISYKGHLHTVSCVKYHAGYVFTGSGDACARVYDAKSGALKAVYRAHSSAITCMNLIGDNLYTGSSDNTLRVWDASKATLESEELLDLMEDEEELEGSAPVPAKAFDEHKLKAYNGEDVDVASAQLKPPSSPHLRVPSPTPSGRSRLSPSPSPLHSAKGRVSPSPSQLSARGLLDDSKGRRSIADLDF
ncbi:WD repeat-containing protein 86-like isoform X2 [Macrobrachium nipponense]